MKILHLIDSLTLGGAERLLVDAINGLPDMEHYVIILNGPERLRSELPESTKFLNLQRKSNWQLYKLGLQVRRYILKNKIDLVHSHLYFASITARLGAPKNVPVLNTLHVIPSLDNYTKNRLSLYLEKLTYRKRHHIIAVSKEVLRDFDQWIGIKGESTVLYNFIEDRFFIDVPQKAMPINSLKLVAVGTLRYQKNYFYLIEAFKSMPPNVELHIWGEGGERASLQKEIDIYKLNIELMGNHSQIQTVLPQYDAFVMSSLFEGQPLALLEAIACGLPPILSDIPVIREVTGPNALYFDLHNPQDMVAKVNSILNKEVDISLFVKPNLEYISGFAKKNIYLTKLRQLYATAIQQKNSLVA